MLTVEHLSKTYENGVQALKDVSLTIPAGMFGLLGPNGAGKSTLMRTIATLQEADSGTIFLDDLDVLKEKDAVRRVLGYLPQEFGLYPRVSAERLLEHFAVLKGISDARQRKENVTALLKMTNLWEVRKQNLGTFSGGMRQRFGIAQALLGSPELIIVDEPTAGLDPQERRRFLNLLSAIGDNIVVILSTHIVDDVRELCSRMAIIDRGRVLIAGEPDPIIESYRGRIWRKAVDRAEAEAYESRFPVISTRLVAGRTVIHVHSESRPEDGFEPVETDLEDVYFATLAQANTPREIASV